MKFKSDIEVQAGLKDSSGSAGASGQLLSSTISGTSWINPPVVPGAGGSSQVFYFNGGTASSVVGYQQMSIVANTGTAADFSINANGYIASFLTDVASPNQLNIPAGNWNFEIYFSASSSGGSPSFYVELYKYSSGGIFTLIASSSAAPEGITNGTVLDAYFTPLAIPATVLLATDRLAVRVYVTHSGRTITMHTQNGHLSDVITTFSTGLTALNGLTAQVQYFAVGTAGTDFGISSATNTHTFNLPTASATNRGALSSADWSIFNGKQNALTNPITGTGTTNFVSKFNSSSSLINSSIQDSGTLVTITNPLTVNGLTNFLGTTASDTAPLGSELAAVTGTGANWTLVGTNLNVGGYTHTVGATTPLTTTLAAVIGTYYQIVYTITGRTAGSIVIGYGGISLTLTQSGDSGQLASSTAVLTITPTSDFDGNIVLSIKTIGTSSASSTFASSSGVTNLEVRANNIVTNTIVGRSSGRRITTGQFNTFYGSVAGSNATTSDNNTFIGNSSGLNNTIGSTNTFLGSLSGQGNISGGSNTAIGYTSLQTNTIGSNNVGLGYGTLQASASAGNNVAVGTQALSSVLVTGNNIAVGSQAGRYIADKLTLATSITSSVLLGYRTSPLANTQSNQIVIGYDATGLGSNTTVLGNSSTVTTAIYGNLLLGTTATNGVDKLQVTGSTNISGQLKLGSTITNNTFTYTLPTATGTLALTSQIPTVSGTTNYLPKFTSATTFGDSQLFDNGTSFGIGTILPNEKLSVNGNMSVMYQTGSKIGFNTPDAFTLYGTSVAYYGMSYGGSTDLLALSGFNGIGFCSSGAERMRVASNGNVGIGTTSTSSKLNVNGDVLLFGVGNAGRLTASDTAVGGASITINPQFSTGVPGIESNGVFPIAFKTNSLERMRIDSGGAVGVGTSSPLARLHSESNAAGPVSYPYRSAIFGNNTSTSTLYPNSIGVAGKTLTSAGMAIYGDASTGGGWGGYFDGKGYFSGNVGIGTTSPSYKLTVIGDSIGVYATGSTYGVLGYSQSVNGTAGISGSGNGVYGTSDFGNGVYGISETGFGGYFSSVENYSLVAENSAAKPGGGSWSVYSDSRIKENIVPYAKGLADILLINPVTYEYNGLANTVKGSKYTGIIAQEIKEIFPDTIGTYKAKLNKEDEDKTELYDFNASDLTFALINAVKELKAEIEELKKLINK